MDPVTHTLVGVDLANGFTRRRLGSGTVPILALASNLPDIDGIVHLTGDPTAILMRRTFGHSLFLLPFWALALAVAVRRIDPRLGLPARFGLCLAGALVHLFFDLVNSFGVVLLWPFSDARPELSIIFIIDFALTGLLALPLCLALAPRLRPRLVAMTRLSLAAVVLYIAFCAANHDRAARLLADEAAAGGERSDFEYVFPEPLGPHRWRGVTREGGLYRVYLIHSMTGEVRLVREERTALDDPRVAEARRSPLGRRLEHFFKAPVWSVEGPETDPRVHVYDLRFRSILVDTGPVFAYTLPGLSPPPRSGSRPAP